MQCAIRIAAVADLDAIQAIYNDAILHSTATWDEAPWSMDQRRQWFREHAADPTTPVLVAEADQRIAGFAYLSWYRTKSGYRFTREDTVYLDPAFHRRGLGRLLLQDLIARAGGAGMHALLAVIESTNQASIGLHASLGFVPTGTDREIGFKFGRWLSATTMELILPGPAARP